MTSVVGVIEVPLPEGVQATSEEAHELESLFRVIAGLRLSPGRAWTATRCALERDGWGLAWGLQWHVEARRGREVEEACGRTLDEAFARIRQSAGGRPPIEGTP